MHNQNSNSPSPKSLMIRSAFLNLGPILLLSQQCQYQIAGQLETQLGGGKAVLAPF